MLTKDIIEGILHIIGVFVSGLTYFYITSGNGSPPKGVAYYEQLIENYSEIIKHYQVPVDSKHLITNKTHDDKPKFYGSYDIIIVGGGSAGSVIARRLSDCGSMRILLIEAGGNENDYSDIPGMMLNLELTDFNWGYKTTTQSTCCQGMVDEQCFYPRGKVLGGSSTINALMYVRGNSIDYDNWAALGNKGWAYKDVLKYFKRSEMCKIPDAEFYFHGYNGDLHVEYDYPTPPVTVAFLESNVRLGREIIDYNGHSQLGCSKTQFNTVKGRRDSGHKAFVVPIQRRSNFYVTINSLALKIEIDKLTKKASGVIFNKLGVVYRATALKEIILTAGSINTPQFLMLSGIGPKAQLDLAGIPIVKELPGVGSNLQEHANFIGLVFTTEYTEKPKNQSEYIKQYLHGNGPFTFAGNSQAVGFTTTTTLPVKGLPNIEWILIPPNNTGPITQRVWNIKPDLFDNYFAKTKPTNSFTIYTILMHPQSRGSVTLKSADPYDFPNIDLHMLSDPGNEDIESLYQGIQQALEVVQQEPFRKLGAKLIDVPVPGCEDKKYLSKEYWYCAIRLLSHHMYHPVGTAKMGNASDEMAVVNQMGMVRGVKGLRVADVSIMPQSVAGHTNAVAFMIAEKISDDLKKQYKYKTSHKFKNLFHVSCS